MNDPDFEADLKGRFGGPAMTYYGRWTYKFEEAARRGAAGVLLVHEAAPASYGWPTVRNSFTLPMFDIVRPDPAAVHPPVEAWIQRDIAVKLFRAAGLDFEAEKKKAQSADFHPVHLQNASLSLTYDVKHSAIVSRNVIGQLPGRSRPAETILYTSHWDHLGTGQPDARGDRIYNGARDNALGVSGLLEIARLFAAAPRTDRTVVFLALTAEEKTCWAAGLRQPSAVPARNHRGRPQHGRRECWWPDAGCRGRRRRQATLRRMTSLLPPGGRADVFHLIRSPRPDHSFDQITFHLQKPAFQPFHSEPAWTESKEASQPARPPMTRTSRPAIISLPTSGPNGGIFEDSCRMWICCIPLATSWRMRTRGRSGWKDTEFKGRRDRTCSGTPVRTSPRVDPGQLDRHGTGWPGALAVITRLSRDARERALSICSDAAAPNATRRSHRRGASGRVAGFWSSREGRRYEKR